jgi:hypothetical protein
MRRDELSELHYIAPVVNLPSILSRGILSHRRAQTIRHESIAMKEVQQRRSRKRVPQGRRLHEYADLYICARNPMLFKRKGEHKHICVLRVSAEVLDLPEVVIADRNAASDWARFAASPDGLRHIDRDLVFAEYWAHPNDHIMHWRHGSIKCAEVLVPDRVDPRHITGAYVSCLETKDRVESLGFGLTVIVDSHLFFR